MKRNLVRLVSVIASVFFLGAVFAYPAASWPRAASTLDISSEDIKLCADEIVVSTRYQANGLAVDTYDPTLGSPYPGNATSSDTVPFFVSAADAVAPDAEPLVAVDVPLYLTKAAEEVIENPDGSLSLVTAVWEGTGSVSDPGLVDGQVVYVRQLDPSSSEIAAVGLTVGADPEYGCAPTVTNFNFDIGLHGEHVMIPTWFPRLISFDSADVDVNGLRASADNSSLTAQARYIGQWRGKAWALVSMRGAGVDCETTQLVVTGETSSGAAIEGSHELFPFGRRC